MRQKNVDAKMRLNTFKNNMSQDKPMHFIRQIIAQDIAEGLPPSAVHTRFPPEPNGCLHIGHAKAFCLDFGMALENGGKCNLRFDDTNPDKEETRFVDAIKEDVHWLGFDWEDREYYASDYFEKLYELAEELIKNGKAYACTLSADEFKEYRGVPGQPGKPSPWRDRPPEESLDIFRRMRAGEFEEGAYVIRAKIDMGSPNLHMRDPAIYRIKKAEHHRTGSKWCIYPMYDFAHCLSDAIEGITHSICTLEFEVHRPLYDWFIDNTSIIKTLAVHPRQYEFARLNLSYTMMSKRKLQQLVAENIVEGWDDPRMPTLAGMRRRGYTAAAIRNFCEAIGVTKFNSLTELALLEHCVRQDLNKVAKRAMAVFDPLEVEIENWDDGEIDMLDAVNNPEDESAGTRKIPFSKRIYIERADFMENPPKKYFRLSPGGEVRLRYAYIMRCKEVVKDAEGNVAKLICTIDPDSRGGNAPDGRKVKGTIHWVSAGHAREAVARLYEPLFTRADMSDLPEGSDFKDFLNPASVEEKKILIEPSLADAKAGEPLQFERNAYFMADAKLHSPDHPVFNRTVALKDSYSK